VVGGGIAVGGVDAAADDGAVSSSTGQSTLSEPVAGGAVLAGSGEGAGDEALGGEGAGEATFGFSLIHPPEVCAIQDRDRARARYSYPYRQWFTRSPHIRATVLGAGYGPLVSRP
jgi:hypothetical protein